MLGVFRFPEAHTYRATLVNATKPLTDPSEVMQTVLEQKQLARKSLGKIHQKELEAGSAPSKVARFGDVQHVSSSVEGARREEPSESSTSNINMSSSPPKPAQAFS